MKNDVKNMMSNYLKEKSRKNEVKMNLVIIAGKITQKIDFKFIYDKYKNKQNEEEKEKLDQEKYKHTSIASSMIELKNGSIVKIYGYDEVADLMYKNLYEADLVLIEGKINSNMSILVLEIFIVD